MSARASLAIAACALAGGCATHGIGDAPRDVRNHAIEPYGTHEECAKLAAGDRLDYAWSADMPLDFDIHYRDGGAIVEPITQKGVTHDTDVYVPVLAQDYCLMWEAGPAGAHLDYRLRVARASR